MEKLATVPEALDLLEVATTATGPVDPNYHIYWAWCDGMVELRSSMLTKQCNLTGILYWNQDLELQTISMIADPADRFQQANWCVGQFGTRLSQGSQPLQFNRTEVCGEIIVPMREPHAKELALVYNKKVVTADNCTLWADFDADTDFPGEGNLLMTAWPIAIPFGQGAVVPHNFDALIASIEAADDRPQILNGKPAPGVVDALKALKKNGFHSYYGTKNKFGMEKKHFSKDFKKAADKPHVYNKMLVKEKNVNRLSLQIRGGDGPICQRSKEANPQNEVRAAKGQQQYVHRF